MAAISFKLLAKLKQRKPHLLNLTPPNLLKDEKFSDG
jgi:hypothetical protein